MEAFPVLLSKESPLLYPTATLTTPCCSCCVLVCLLLPLMSGIRPCMVFMERIKAEPSRLGLAVWSMGPGWCLGKQGSTRYGILAGAGHSVTTAQRFGGWEKLGSLFRVRGHPT